MAYRINAYHMFPQSVVDIAKEAFDKAVDRGDSVDKAFKDAFYEALSNVPAYSDDGEVLDKDRIILQLRLNVQRLYEKIQGV